jgi:hypothetical protein
VTGQATRTDSSMFPIRIYSFFLTFIFFLQTVSCKDYLIWLSSPNITDGKIGKEYLENHIRSMQQIVPSFKLHHSYNNLVLYGFLIYSASIDETQDWELFLELTPIKLMEDVIPNYRIAQSKVPIDYVPFVPPQLDEVTVSKDGAGLCTLTYDFIQKVITDQTKLHEMVGFLLLCLSVSVSLCLTRCLGCFCS